MILGQLAATINTDKQKRSYTSFLHGGQGCARKRLLSYMASGRRGCTMSPSITWRMATQEEDMRHKQHHALSLDCVKFVVTFILNYSELHGLVLPGRVPDYSRSDIQLLPSSTSKHSIWQQYYSSSTSTSHRAVVYSTFCLLWRTLVHR